MKIQTIRNPNITADSCASIHRPPQKARREDWIHFPLPHLGKVDIEEEGLLGVGDLDAVLLMPLRAGTGTGRGCSARDAEVVHGLGDLLHRRRREET